MKISLTPEQLEMLKLQRFAGDVGDILTAVTHDADLIRAARPAGGNRIIDIGCGLGLLMAEVGRDYKEVHLLDWDEPYNPEMRHGGWGTADTLSPYNDMEYAEQIVKQYVDPNTTKVFKWSPDNRPDKVDIDYVMKFDFIVSTSACGWHFPTSEYLPWIAEHMDKNGHCLLKLKKLWGNLEGTFTQANEFGMKARVVEIDNAAWWTLLTFK